MTCSSTPARASVATTLRPSSTSCAPPACRPASSPATWGASGIVVGQYLLVRQADAHAWAEVWGLRAAAGHAWTPPRWWRPSGCERGVFDLHAPGLSAPASGCMHGAPWLQQLLQRWDAANCLVDRARGEVRLRKPAGPPGAAGDQRHRTRATWVGPSWPPCSPGLRSSPGTWAARAAGTGGATALARAYLRLCRKLARAGARAPAAPGPARFRARHSARCTRSSHGQVAGAARALRAAALRGPGCRPGARSRGLQPRGAPPVPAARGIRLT